MADPTQTATSQSPWQRRLTLLAAALFPLLVASGLFAPQVVSLMAVEEEAEEPRQELTPVELDFSDPIHNMPPLSLPRDFGVGFVPELLDLHTLFRDGGGSRSFYTPDPLSQQFARLLSFPRDHGDVIVLDDVDRQIRDIVFKDPIMVGATTGAIGPPDPDLLGLGNPRPHGDGLRFDAPQLARSGLALDPLAPVPEPSSGAVVLLGLAALALRARRSR
jgi:hypothetical protein